MPPDPHPREARSGPWPFITRRVVRHLDDSLTEWRSRHHRKHLPLKMQAHIHRGENLLGACLWMPQELNWWIGMLFAIGSLLFILGSGFSLAPGLARYFSLDGAAVGALFFIGSLPFTTAAYLQLFQATNVVPFGSRQQQRARRKLRWFGWKPKDVGWWSCALQFPGTILFNFNTFDAMLPDLSWAEQDLVVWIPNLLGSILFLLSGYLAFIETCHAYWSWQVHSLSWWVTFVNLLGCVGFMLSALTGFFVPAAAAFPSLPTISLLFTLLGGLGFLVGSLLMLPETVVPS